LVVVEPFWWSRMGLDLIAPDPPVYFSLGAFVFGFIGSPSVAAVTA